MLKTKEGLSTINQKLNDYLSPINEKVGNKKDITDQTKALTEAKTAKYSYPKNGLYGLL
jgi:hypothetical protein